MVVCMDGRGIVKNVIEIGKVGKTIKYSVNKQIKSCSKNQRNKHDFRLSFWANKITRN